MSETFNDNKFVHVELTEILLVFLKGIAYTSL